MALLWRELVTVLKEYGTIDPDGTDPIVATIVAEFSKVDPQSYSYRYPVDVNGNLIPIEHEQLDLAVLADVMKSLDAYFTGCDGYLDHLQGAMPSEF